MRLAESINSELLGAFERKDKDVWEGVLVGGGGVYARTHVRTCVCAHVCV